MKSFFTKFKYELFFILVFVLVHLPSLGNDSFNTDVWKWKARSYDFGSGIFSLNFEKTIQKYHPGVTLMWLGTVSIKFFNVYLDISKISPDSISSLFGLHFVQKLLVVLATAISIGFAFYPLRVLFGKKYALISFFLLTLEPFYMALTREFHLEGLMSTFMLVSIIWYFYNFVEPSKKKLFLAAFFAGLAFLTKTSSLYLIPFFGLTTFLYYFIYHKQIFVKKFIFTYFIFLLTSIFVVFLMWPALWTNTLEALQAIQRGIVTIGVDREHEQYYFGKLVFDPGPFYYLVVYALRSSAILFIGIILAFIFAQKYTNEKNKLFIRYLLIFTFFYFIELTIPSKKLDRYILPAFTSLILICSFFYEKVYDYLQQTKLPKFAPYTILLFLPVFTCLRIHPDYFSFYNPLFGGLKTGIRVLEPKWLIGTPQIISYFKNIQTSEGFKKAPEGMSLEEMVQNNIYKSVLLVAFPEKYYTQIWPFFEKFGSWAVISDLIPQAKISNYFVYPVWADDSASTSRFNLQYKGSIYIRGVEIYKVYTRIGEK